MAQYRDLEDMLEIITLALVKQETEEEFFRRSAEASTSKVAKDLYSEIADDLGEYRDKLELRRQKLVVAVGGNRDHRNMKGPDEIIIRDPVCGMKIDRNKCPFESNHKGKEYCFCSKDCMTAFEADPEKYI